jgi:hypothetical protein
MLHHRLLRTGLLGLLATTVLSLACTTSSPAAATAPRIFAFIDEFPTPDQQARLQAVAPQIGVAAPEWCGIRGTTFGCDDVDQSLLALGAANGFGVWPVVNRADPGADDPLLATAATRRQAADAIAAWAAQGGVAGITLDVEGVDPGRANAFTNFVNLLSKNLHRAGRSLAVYVPRRTGAKASAWSAAYQWGALSDAADLLLASSYSESWETPGPIVTSAGFDALLDFAAAYGTDRVAPVLPAFAQRWAPGAAAPDILPAAVAAARGDQVGLATQRDGEASYLDGGAVTWFETGEGLAQRRQTAGQAGFSWVALFLLGWEPASFWEA